MTIKPFFPVFIVLVGVVAYGYYTAEKRPEKATTLSPKQYIELVEEKKSARKEVVSQEERQPASNNPK